MIWAKLSELFVAFLEIGAFTFGGGYAMIPLIQQMVDRYGWLADTPLSIVDFIAVSESTPGPFAINIATFLGMIEGGIPGAVVATLGVVLPSFLIILLIARFFARFGSDPKVKAVMGGIRPIVVGILFSVMLTFVVRAIFHVDVLVFSFTGFDLFAFLIFGVILILSRTLKKISPILLIVLSAGLGIVLYGLV